MWKVAETGHESLSWEIHHGDSTAGLQARLSPLSCGLVTNFLLSPKPQYKYFQRGATFWAAVWPLLETTLFYSAGLSPAAHAATDAAGTWHRPHSLCFQVTRYQPTALTSMKKSKSFQYKSQDIVNRAGNEKCYSPDYSSKWAVKFLHLLWRETVSFS